MAQDAGSIDTSTAAEPASTCSPLRSPRTVTAPWVDSAVTVYAPGGRSRNTAIPALLVVCAAGPVPESGVTVTVAPARGTPPADRGDGQRRRVVGQRQHRRRRRRRVDPGQGSGAEGVAGGGVPVRL